MNQTVHNKSISFILSAEDDCFRDVIVRRKYCDVIFPMLELRRLDAFLEPTKAAVLEELFFKKGEALYTVWDENGFHKASDYVLYNSSKWTHHRFQDIVTNNQLIIYANFEAYIRGYIIIETGKIKVC
jgi:type I restriction enzyme M protein